MTITKKAFIGILSLTAASYWLLAQAIPTKEGILVHHRILKAKHHNLHKIRLRSHQLHLPLISLRHHQMQGRLQV